MTTYLIKKIMPYLETKNVNYYDWYLNKFVENENKTPLKKLYTKHFNNYDEAIKIANKYDAKLIRLEF